MVRGTVIVITLINQSTNQTLAMRSLIHQSYVSSRQELNIDQFTHRYNMPATNAIHVQNWSKIIIYLFNLFCKNSNLTTGKLADIIINGNFVSISHKRWVIRGLVLAKKLVDRHYISNLSTREKWGVTWLKSLHVTRFHANYTKSEQQCWERHNNSIWKLFSEERNWSWNCLVAWLVN